LAHSSPLGSTREPRMAPIEGGGQARSRMLASSRCHGSLRAILLVRYGKIEVNLRACRVHCLSHAYAHLLSLRLFRCYLPPYPALPSGGVRFHTSPPMLLASRAELVTHPLIICHCRTRVKALHGTCAGSDRRR